MTAADFYLGRGTTARWIGSLRHQADPVELATTPPGLILLASATSLNFTQAVGELLTLPTVAQNGEPSLPATEWPWSWPWSWPDSSLTGWCYAFDTRVWVSYFGRAWFPCPTPDCDEFEVAVDRQRRSSSDGPRAVFSPQSHSTANFPGGR